MGKMLDALLGRSFTTKKFESLLWDAHIELKCSMSVFQNEISQATSDVTNLLKLGHHEKAYSRADKVIEKQNYLDVYTLVIDYLRLLIDGVHLFEQNKDIPEELLEAVSSFLFAAPRIRLIPYYADIQDVRNVLLSRFGQNLAAQYLEMRDNCGINPQIIEKLSKEPSLREVRMKFLEELAAKENIVLKLDEAFTFTKISMAANDNHSRIVAVYNNNDPNNSLIEINMSSITKLTASNYLTWRLQVLALLEAHELQSFIDNAEGMPPATVTNNGLLQPNPAHAPWKQQDQMLYNALIGSLSLPIQPVVARAVTAHDVWTILECTYGTASRGHIIQIKQQLKRSVKGAQTITEYMRGILTKADQLALLGKPYDHEDLLDIITEGLGDDYRAIVEMVQGCDVPISIDELHDKLLNRENSLFMISSTTIDTPATANAAQYRPNNNNSSCGCYHPSQNGHGGYRPQRPYLDECQICSTQGHSARRCPQFVSSNNGAQPQQWTYPSAPTAPPHWQTPLAPPQWQPQTHYTTSTSSETAPWLLDSGASHHFTSNLGNLSLASQYNGGEDVLIGDGTGLKITHTGSSSLPSTNRPLILSDVLCVPHIKKNLISINKLCKANDVMVQLCPSTFQVKDLKSGTTMVQGKASGDLYEWPSISSQRCRVSFVI